MLTEPITQPRKSWDDYFMGIAQQVATRATCDRKRVGAIIVRDKMTLSTGYNGSIRGLPHCDDVGHLMEGADEVIALVRDVAGCAWDTMEDQESPLSTELRDLLSHCVATVHAEANAIIQAARNGVRIDGATIYTTASPCFSCFKLIANAGIIRIVFGEFYRDQRIFEYAEKLKIELVSPSQEVPT